jgi:hypothetical protein
MNSKVLFRIAAGCILFFVLGHSFGHFTRHSTSDPDKSAFLKVLAEKKFDMFGYMRSFDENYTGMSLNLIFTLIMLTIILWTLGGNANSNPLIIRKIAIPVAACILGFSITSFLYFFPVPGITCMLAFIFTGLAMTGLKTN